MITAEIKADSISEQGVRLTTMELTYPRYIHAEFMTHRQFSRNAASSRAIPAKKKIEAIEKCMAYPVEWGKNQKGMTASELLSPEDEQLAKVMWERAGQDVIRYARRLDQMAVHKQCVNRITEPWSHITVIMSSTEWSNHEWLRTAPDADPTYQVLAKKMKVARDESTPKLILPGSWHLPYVFHEDWEKHGIEELKLISAGRCARVSYLTHEGKRDTAEDVVLAMRIAKGGHMTPFEHQATPIGGWSRMQDMAFTVDGTEVPMICRGCGRGYKEAYVLSTGESAYHKIGGRVVCNLCAQGHLTSGNFFGWRQHRKEIANECR